MAYLGICSNVDRCSKAAARDLVELYPGFGEVCPECGRPLTPVSQGGAVSAGVAPTLEGLEGQRPSAATSVIPPPPPAGVYPAPRPRALITGHSPGVEPPPNSEPASRAAPMPIIPPIKPLDPGPPSAGPPSAANPPPPYASSTPAAPAYSTEGAFPQQAAPPPAYEAQPPQPYTQQPAYDPSEPRFGYQQAPAQDPNEPFRPSRPLFEAENGGAGGQIAPYAPPEHEETGPSERWFIPPPEDLEGGPRRGGRRRAGLDRKYVFAAVGAGLLAAAGFFGLRTLTAPKTPASATFNICGPSNIADQLGTNLAKAFLAKEGAQGATVAQNGSRVAVSAKLPGEWSARTIMIDSSDEASVIAAVAGKSCQVGLMATPVDNRGDLANSGILGKVIGYDAIVVVANPANRVTTLSLGQLAGIFSGSITNWSSVGGPNASIHVFAPEEPAYYLSAFRRLLLKAAVLPPSARIVDSQNAVSAAVARDQDAIGFVGFLYAEPGHVMRIQSPEGATMPTVASIGQKAYPLTVPMFLYYTAQQTEPMVFDFLDFVRSDAGQTVVEDKGFVSRLSL